MKEDQEKNAILTGIALTSGAVSAAVTTELLNSIETDNKSEGQHQEDVVVMEQELGATDPVPVPPIEPEPEAVLEPEPIPDMYMSDIDPIDPTDDPYIIEPEDVMYGGPVDYPEENALIVEDLIKTEEDMIIDDEMMMNLC